MRFPIRIYKVKDRSMEPMIKEGDYVLVSGIVGNYAIGDVVVVKRSTENILIIKRISGVQGNSYSLSGDNKELSVDSGTFGPVARSEIIGKVLLRI